MQARDCGDVAKSFVSVGSKAEAVSFYELACAAGVTQACDNAAYYAPTQIRPPATGR